MSGILKRLFVKRFIRDEIRSRIDAAFNETALREDFNAVMKSAVEGGHFQTSAHCRADEATDPDRCTELRRQLATEIIEDIQQNIRIESRFWPDAGNESEGDLIFDTKFFYWNDRALGEIRNQFKKMLLDKIDQIF